MSRFHEKTVVITGAGRGIGAAAALKFGAEGAKVALLSRNQLELDKVAAAILKNGGEAYPIVCDVANEEAVRNTFLTVEKHFGGIDIVVNNAGIIANSALECMSTSTFDDILAVNVRGVFLCSKYAFASMKKRGGGAIINISSLAGIRGTEKFPGFSAYTASKFAVIGLTEAHSVEGRPHGIRVNAIAPGAINTDMLRKAAPSLKSDTNPEEVADVILYLADTNSSKALTGSVIEIFSNA